MKIGFTGTRKGMTSAQRDVIEELLVEYQPTEVHHGDCIGADAQFDGIAKKLKICRVIHPPDRAIYRAFCKGEVVLPERPYLDRNYDIVNTVDIMIACPAGTQEILQSGTWSTVRCARTCLSISKLIIVFPKGTIKEER
jgi:hypothetical protein